MILAQESMFAWPWYNWVLIIVVVALLIFYWQYRKKGMS